MKKGVLVVVVLVTLLGLLFGGGDLKALDIYSSLRGIRAAAQGQRGAFMMAKEGVDMILFAWPTRGGAWGFAGLTRTGSPINNLLTYVNATSADIENMVTFVSGLQDKGWREITSEALPPALLATLQSIPVYLMSIGARSFVSPLFVPASVLERQLSVPVGVDG